MLDITYDEAVENKNSIKLNVLMAVGILCLIATIFQDISGTDIATALIENNISNDLVSLLK